MSGPGHVNGAFDAARANLRWVGHYLSASPESVGELELRQVAALFDAAEPLLALWRTVAGADRAAHARGTTALAMAEIRAALMRASRLLPVNIEGNRIESHLLGTATTIDALVNLLADATSAQPRSPALLRKAATGAAQTAMHRYGVALRAPDTVVQAVRTSANYENRIELTRRLHRGTVDMASGVEAWTR